MTWLIGIGTAMTVIGLGLLGYCIYEAFAAKKSGLDDDAMRRTPAKIVAINMGALLLSVLGLMCVVVGVVLG